MPAHLINFQPRFAEAIESGAKRQTMRPPRKRAIFPGDRLRLYTGLRTAKARLLREVECRNIQTVELGITGATITDFSRRIILSIEANDTLAKSDGFGSYGEMLDWFESRYGKPPFHLEIIAW